MTLDAMNWVWTQSKSTGHPRVVLLYVADQVRTLACEARIGQRELMAAMGTRSKDTAAAAVRAAVTAGELEVVEAGSGRRAALYRLPKAVGFVRSAPGAGAQTLVVENRSAPPAGAQSSGSAPPPGAQTDDLETRSAPAGGAQNRRSAPAGGALSHTHSKQAGQQQENGDAFTRCQPLIHAMTDAGITVSWTMQPADWLEIDRLIQRAGIDAMVAFARQAAAGARKPPMYARFFLQGGWRGLPPKSTRRPAARPATTTPWCEDSDCDPVSRTREAEDDRGLRTAVPCPNCHPARKGHAA